MQRAEDFEVDRDWVRQDLIAEVLREMDVAGRIISCRRIIPPKRVFLNLTKCTPPPRLKEGRDGMVVRDAGGGGEAEDGEVDQAVQLLAQLKECAFMAGGRSDADLRCEAR